MLRTLLVIISHSYTVEPLLQHDTTGKGYYYKDDDEN